ncbi:phosphonate C-P lyase system protein PhnG [Dinghuibacter silviterrae]|uniref:Alpha-D-ribose 1-methylphosphonate 5-triphosphate synthase subunit PhnG n=1 Tax=Dinghuibacter silviterrae TaxID=1539049 RepID=A0A4R8DRJ8_9BACT|nr:phosphonate C-P lyase system protein PhnG [Dinghuibacter silviterrae]TDX00832.1 alpha-D-ribose 1-methylphosphonate 5-triphosphate synthase subunit PhnG [Dinghuibacter silviterrae]
MHTPDEILCACSLDALEAFVRTLEPLYTVVIARYPTLATTMICAEDSVEGQPFYLGEALVTETALVLDGQTGYGICLGDEPVRSYCIAFIDAALLLGGDRVAPIQAFVEVQGAFLEEARRIEHAQIQRTKVDFKLMEQD